MAQGPKMNNLGVPGGGRNNLFLYWLAKQGARKDQASPVRGQAPMTKRQWKNMEEFERVRMELQDNARANEIANMSEADRRAAEHDMAKIGFQGDVEKDMFSHGADVTASTWERMNKGQAAQNELDADRLNALREKEAADRAANAQAQADATPSPLDSGPSIMEAQDEAAESGDAEAAGSPGAPGTGAAAAAAGVQAPLDRSATPYVRQAVTPNISASVGGGISGKVFTTAADAELIADKQGRTGRGGPAEVGGPKGKGKGEKPKEEPVKEKDGGKAAEGEKVDPVQAALDQVRMLGVKTSASGRKTTPADKLSGPQREQMLGAWDEYKSHQASDLTEEDYPELAQALATNMFSELTPEQVAPYSKAQRDRVENFVVRKPERGGPAEPEKQEEPAPQEEPTPAPAKSKGKGGGRKKQEAPVGGPVVQDGPPKQEEPAKPETPPASTDTDTPPPPMGFGDLGNY